MSRRNHADRGRLTLADRVLVSVCLHPGSSTHRIAEMLDQPVTRVLTALWTLRVSTPSLPAVRREGSKRDARWWPTSDGRARMLETRRTFEAAVAARGGGA